MVRRAETGLWEMPGGHLDGGEPVEYVFSRELLEETGIRATGVIQLGGHGLVHHGNPHVDLVGIMITDWGEGDPVQLSPEFDAHRMVRLDPEPMLVWPVAVPVSETTRASIVYYLTTIESLSGVCGRTVEDHR